MKASVDVSSKGLRHWLKAFVPAILIAATVAGLLRRHEDQLARAQFRDAAAEEISLVSERVDTALASLQSLGAFYDTSIAVSGEQFARFTNALFAQKLPIQALEWIPRISATQRTACEAAARRDGFPQFRITARDSRGLLVPEGARASYYPVFFANPLEANRKAIGFDLASNPQRLAALTKAMESGAMVATSRITLVQETANQYGFLVFRPVYRGGTVPPTTAQRERELVGFVLGVFRVGDLIDGRAPKDTPRIRVRVFDDSAPAASRLIYPKLPTAEASDVPASGLRGALDVGGRRWTVVASPAPEAFLPNRSASTAASILGLFASALWAFYVRQRASRVAAIERAVDERTAELDAQRRFSAAIFDSLGGVGIVLDREGSIIRLNKAAENFTGHTLDAVKGIPFFWARFLPPEQRSEVESVFERFRSGTLPGTFENEWVGRDGERRLFAWTNTVLADAAGAPAYLVSIGLDITELKRSQRQIELERLRYRTILQTASDGIHILDRNGRLVEANQAFLQMLGYDADAIGRLHVTDWDANDEWDTIRRRNDRVREGGESLLFETRHRHRDGHILDVEINAKGIEIDGESYLYAASRDIGERKRAAQALAASEERYRQFFEVNSAIKLIVDPDSDRIVDANPAAVAFYGYSREHLLSMRIADISDLTDDESAREAASAQAQGRLYFNGRHRLASGEVRDVEVYAGPSVAHGQSLLYSIVHDVTERRKAVQLQEALLENTTSGILIARKRVIVSANGAMMAMLGRAGPALLGQSTRCLYPDENEFARVGAAHAALHAAGGVELGNVRLRASAGDVIVCDLRGRLLPDGETSVWTFTDVTAREAQARRVRRAQGVYRALAAATQSLLHSTTESGMIGRLCGSLVTGTEFTAVWLGVPDAQGLFRVAGRASASNSNLSFLDDIRVVVTDENSAIARAWRAHGTIVHQDNLAQQASSPYAADLRRLEWASTLAAVVDRGGQAWGVLVYVCPQAGWFDENSRDACEQVSALLGHGLDELDFKADLARLQKQESQRARTDPLTGLPNRLALGEHLPTALARAQRHHTVVAVGVFDLDDFKPVNDRYGHPAGDVLLKKLASALRDRLRTVDFIARLGGDEFVVVLEDLDPEQPLIELHAAFARLHTAVQTPYDLGEGRSARIGMTMGVALYPTHATEPDALLRLADAAMYAGKAHKVDREQWWSIGPAAPGHAEESVRELKLDPFGDEARVLLTALDSTMLKAVAKAFSETFYEELAKSPDLARVLNGLDPDEFNRLRNAQSEHLLFLLSPETSAESLTRNATVLGAIHALVGVSGANMEKSFGLYEDLLRAKFENTMYSSRERYRILRVTTARLRLDVQTQLVEIEKTVREYSELLEVQPSSGARWVDILPALVKQLGELRGMRYAIVFRPDEHGQLRDEMGSGPEYPALSDALRTRDLYPSLNRSAATMRGPVSNGWFSRDVQIVDAYRLDPNLARWHPLAREFGWRSAATIPIVRGDETESVVMLLGQYPNQFSSDWARSWLGALHNRLNALFAATARDYQPIDPAEVRRYRELLYADGLRLWVQPVVHLQSGAVTKVEALARLQAPAGQVLDPATFLPAFGVQQLQALFVQGLGKALDLVHGWRDAGFDIEVSVNLSPSTLIHPDSARWVERALRDAQVAPRHLTLEILESEDLDQTRASEAIHALSALGVNIALDDLGAGYSSLMRLASLPIHTVKIDQALVRELPKDPIKTIRLLSTLLRIGQEFAPVTVVEGLEDEGFIEAAKILGADYGQGFALARPMPADALIAWAQARPIAPPNDRHLHTWLGALAYHWRVNHDRTTHAPEPIELAACPLTVFLASMGVDDSDVLHWHAQCHIAVPAGVREMAATALLHWLSEMVRHTSKGRS